MTTLNPIPVCMLFGIKDLKADECTQFFTDKNAFSAMRGFAHMVSREGSLLGEFPDDFALVHLATVKSDGSVEPVERPVLLSVARDFVGKPTMSYSAANPGPKDE